MPDSIKPVNLPFSAPDLVGNYNTVYQPDNTTVNPQEYHNDISNFLQQHSKGIGQDFSTTPSKNIDFSGRYPLFFPGRDNESMYANAQTGFDKAYNGVVKMAGTASATFLDGTAGLVYGIYKGIDDGKFSSFYDNKLSNELNDWTQGLENTYAHYKSERERNSDWWEPTNLFSGNFLWDGIVKNLGFSLGAAAAGFAWGGVLEGIGLTGKLMSTGVKMASAADNIIAEAAILPEIERLSTINSKLNSLWNSTKGKIGAGLMKADQGIAATFGTFGEASMEALNNSQEFRKATIAEFTRTHGYAPSGKELEEINSNAESVGKWSFGLNTVLLTATNYIQFPKIYSSSFKAERGLANNILLSAEKEGEKYISTLPEKGFGKLLYKAKNIAGLFVNEAEGFEEGAQYAIQTGTKNYFNKKYNNQERSILDDGILYGIKEALTTSEGTLNIFTGAFSGALQSSGFVGIKNGLPTIGQTGKIGERGLTGYGGTQAKDRQEQIDVFNKSMIKDKLKDAYSNIKASEKIQQEREAAIRQGDVLESKDLEFDYAHNFITTRLKYNAKTAIDNEIADLKEKAITNFDALKQQGVTAETDTQQTFIKRLDNLQAHANNTAKMYEAATLKYKGLLNKETGKRLYTDDVIDKLVYAGSKIMDYDNRVPQLNTSLAENGINTLDVLNDIINEGVPQEEAVKKAISDIKDLNSINEDDLLTDLKDVIELSLRRKSFIEEYKDIKKNPQNYQKEETVELDNKGNVLDADGKVIPSEIIKIKSKNSKGVLVEKDIEIGTEYIVGKITEKDKKGNEVYRGIRIKVVGKTEDGKLQIEDVKTGKITLVDPSKLEDYQLGRASDATKKQIWIANNWNKVFVHKGRKDKNGKFLEGRIQNHPGDGMMYFVYTDEKGKEQKLPVTNDMFVSKDKTKYKEGIISPRETLKAVDQQDFEQLFGEKEDITSDQINNRNNYLADLHDQGIKRIDDINKKLESNKQTLENKAKELAEKNNDLVYTKKGTLRKSGFTAIQNTINTINSVIENLESYNAELSAEKDELEYTIPFYEDAIQQLSEFANDNSVLIDKMQSQVKLVKDLISVTDDSIKRTQSLIEQANDLFVRASESIEKFIEKLKNNNSDLKTIFIDKYQEDLERFLGEEGAKQVLNDKLGYTRRLLELQTDITSFTDDINLPKLGDDIKKLTDDILDLNKGLEELTKEKNKREEILNKFKTFVDNKEKIEKEETNINKNPKVKKAAINTKDTKTIQTRESNANYEPVRKKPTNIIPRSTSGVDRGRPHQTRAKNFGIRFPRLSNKNEIRGIYITAKTEAKLGIPGLIDKLIIDDEGNVADGIAKDKVVVLVMVNTDGKFVNEFGEEITEGSIVDQAIYQTKPDPSFQWGEEFGNKTMFRDGTPQEVIDEIKAKYSEEIEEILSDDYIAEPHTIASSFGIPIIVRDEEGNINYDARTSLKEADLIASEEELENKQVVIVPTKGDNFSKGLVEYNNAVGRPFAQTENGIVPLQNRQHTHQESETIFSTLVELAKTMMNPKEGITSNKAVRLLNYLKSVVYWGLPEDASGKRVKTGYNSIFFEEDKNGNLMLTISNNGFDVKFTPSELELNRGEVIDMIQDLYGNVNSHMSKAINSSYEQITSISEDGSIESIIWPNYQSYLVSSVMPDANGEIKNDGKQRVDIPLTTVMKPVNKEANELNKTAVYFYTTDNTEDYAFAEIERRTVTTPKKIIAGKLTGETKTKDKTSKETDWEFDGETPNDFTTDKGVKLQFTIDEDNNIEIVDIKNAKALFVAMKKGLEASEGREYSAKEVGDRINDAIKLQILSKLPAQEEQEEETSQQNRGGFNPFGGTERTIANFSEEENEQEAEEEEKAEKEDKKPTKKPTPTPPKFTRGRRALREVILNKLGSTVTENWKDVESFIKTNFPNVPVYRVKNILENGNGTRQAWGMFKDGALYLYENAEAGTVYHEVFEGIWEMFTSPRERANLIKEFKSREGEFVDRPTGQLLKYSKANPSQIREQLAEECRDYFQEGIMPPKPAGKTGIIKFFADLLNAIKNFFIGSKAESNTERIFEKLGKGYYAKNFGAQSNLAYAKKGIIDEDRVIFSDEDNLREKLPLSDSVRNEIIQEMTYATLSKLIANDKSLFEESALIGDDLYNSLFNDIIGLIEEGTNIAEQMKFAKEITAKQLKQVKHDNEFLKKSVLDNWDTIVKRHKEYLKGYQIEFDDNDTLQVRDEDRVKESDNFDATKIDGFKKANRAIKLLLSTLPYINEEGFIDETSIGGARLIPVSKVFVSLLNGVANANTPTQMMEKLRIMAINDANYKALYERLTKKSVDDGVADLSNISTTHASQLITAFWKTFKKYNSAVRNVTILENGEVSVGEAHLSNVANQLRDQFQNNILVKAKQKKGYFIYNEKEKAYISDSLKAKSIKLTTKVNLSSFLKELGVDFSVEEIINLDKNFPKEYNKLKDAAFGIKDSLVKGTMIYKLNAKYANISTRLLQLGYIKSKLANPDANSTFYNISGEPTQSYIGANAPSQLFEAISSLQALNQEELSDYPQYNYLLSDVFTQGSRVLKRIFGKDGKRKEDESGELDDLMQAGYVGGIDNQERGKQKPSSKLTYRERLIQEINLNIKGWYLNLIPGDSSLEHMTKMGNEIKSSDLAKGMSDVHKIFKDYFISELNLSREDRPIVNIKLSKEDEANGKRQRRSTDLRFFKSILENVEGKTADQKNKLHDEIVAFEGTTEEVYEKFATKINKALEDYIAKDAQYMANALTIYNIASGETGITLSNIALPKNMGEQQFDREMKTLSINYMIANIEMHKLLYSDPYQYAEELKRIKSFNSPRQLIVGNDDGMNQVFNNVWNKGFKKGDIGYTEFATDSFKTITLKDINGVVNLENYKGYKETDGGGVILQKAYRQFRIRSGEWNDAEENQYRYDVAYEKVVKGLDLSPEDESFNIQKVINENGNIKYVGNNPKVQSAYTNLKPIVTGNKNDGNSYNDVVLDKFALYPLSFRILHELNTESNAIRMYDKLQSEKIDYAIFESGRKVGAQNAHAVYTDNGKFNNSAFVATGEERNIINIPFEIMAVQSEVPSKSVALTRRGTQITKLITLDYMDAGVPVDFMDDTVTEEDDNLKERYAAWYSLSEDKKKEASELYKEIKNNQDLLVAMTNEGVKSLLKSFGIEKIEVKDKKGNITNSYKITDFSEAGKTLRDEIFKREVNDNISDALNLFLDKGIALETSPAYQQVRNILYSIADREVISPKISGGMKVQIPSSLLESIRAEKTTINGKEGYTSELLNFYSKSEDGKTVNVCELMIGRWFKSSMSDEDLLKYLNDTEEGQRILSGLAYRIPTQQQNSIDVFKIKQFLPEEFKDSVVIPAALVEKTGSDFDIDKLSMYLKNVFEDINGNLKLVPYYGIGEEAKSKFGKLYEELIKSKLEKIANSDNFRESLFELFDALENNQILSNSQKDFYTNLGPVIDEIRAQAELKDITPREYALNQIVKQGLKEEKLTNDLLNEDLRQDFIDRKYKQSLENAFIESGEKLVSHPKNFDKLIRPNSAEELKDLSKFIYEKVVGKKIDYTDVGNMLNRRFMSSLRHAFVTGKYAIGIAAVNQTNHSLNQRQLIYLDFDRLKNVSPEDREWLGDAKVKFEKYNKIEVGNKIVATLSKVKNAVGKDISNILGQFIDGYVDISAGPWIMELGATPNVASTWMFLVKVGVPIDTVAYFMNQPIVKDYLRSIENDGYSYLFMDTYVKQVIKKYGTEKSGTHHSTEFKAKQKNFKIPTNSVLKETVGKKTLTPQEKETQQHILVEFLKYAKMSEQMFHVTQGSNFDTANFNDPYLVLKKQVQLVKAQKTIIASLDKDGKPIAGVDAILNNSFLRNMANSIFDFRDALATILLSDQKITRNVLQKVLMPHTDLNDNDFVKVAQKVVADFFDWAVQTDGGMMALNKSIEKLMIKNQGILPQVVKFIDEIKDDSSHPLHNNQIINILQAMPSSDAKGNTVNNISVKGTDNKVFDQNNIIYAFRELRDYLKDSGDTEYKNLYNNLVKVSILQSGLSNSKIAYSSVLPFEDFQEVYNNVIGKLATIGNLDDFYKLGVFERNNANNDDVVPNKRAGYIASIGIYNPSMHFLEDNIKVAVRKGIIPNIITQSTGDKEAKYDYITYSWEEDVDITTEERKRGINSQAAKKSEMRKAGDYSFVKKGLFKKVYDKYGKPLPHSYITKDGEARHYFVYKAINAWGDSFRANEFYNEERQSVIDNGFIKVNDVNDDVIISAFAGAGPKELSEMTGFTAEKVITKETLAKEKSNAPTVGYSAETDDYYEPFSYDESGYDPYAEYDITPGELLEDYSQSTGETIGGNTKTPVEGVNERLYNYGFTDLIIPSNYFEGARPAGRLNSFKTSIKQVADNIQILKDLNLNEFDFLSANDKQRLDALRPKVEEFSKLNMTISSNETRTVGVEKRYAQLSNEILNEFVDVIGKHVKKQLGKTIKTSIPLNKNVNKKSVPLQSEKNNPKGLPSIDRTNKKC